MSKTETEKTKYIAGVLLFIATVLFAASWYVKEQQSDYRSALQVKIAEQETRMTRLAELSDRDGVDSVVDQLVRDCELEERKRFDSLLGSLSQLNRAELIEVDQLFGVCGGYYADRKAVLISRLKREYEVYQQYVELMSLTDRDTSLYGTKLAAWQALVEAEGERSRHTTELVRIQKDIITQLIAGERVDSEAISKNLGAAQSAKDSLLFLDTDIDEIRSTLSDI